MFLIGRIYNIAAFTGTNPTKGVKLPAIRNARERFLSGEEVELLHKFTKSSIFMLLLCDISFTIIM